MGDPSHALSRVADHRQFDAKLSAIQGRDGTQDATAAGAATMVVARSATGHWRTTRNDLGRPQDVVGRMECPRDDAGQPKVSPTFARVGRGSRRTVPMLRPQGRPRGLERGGRHSWRRKCELGFRVAVRSASRSPCHWEACRLSKRSRRTRLAAPRVRRVRLVVPHVRRSAFRSAKIGTPQRVKSLRSRHRPRP